MSPTRRPIKTLASAAHTLLFWLASSGIVATASVALYKAYDEYIVKPRQPAIIEQQNKELESLRNEKKVLEYANKSLRRDNDELGALAFKYQEAVQHKEAEYQLEIDELGHSKLYLDGPRVERSSDGHYLVNHAYDIKYLQHNFDQNKRRLEELLPETKKFDDTIRAPERRVEEEPHRP